MNFVTSAREIPTFSCFFSLKRYHFREKPSFIERVRPPPPLPRTHSGHIQALNKIRFIASYYFKEAFVLQI